MLGDNEVVSGSATLAITATHVTNGVRAVQTSVGGFHRCTVLSTGCIRCSGWNSVGQLGYGHDMNVGDTSSSILGAYSLCAGGPVAPRCAAAIASFPLPM